jgi:DNA-binding XRE family transcriptional regulator
MSTWNRWAFIVMRKELGMSQTEAGEWLGVSQKWIENWESGNFRPNSHTKQIMAQKIAQKWDSPKAFAVTGVRVPPSVLKSEEKRLGHDPKITNENTITICKEAGLNADEIKQLDGWIDGCVVRDQMLATTTYDKLFKYFAYTKKTMPYGVIKSEIMCPFLWILKAVRWDGDESYVNVDANRVDLNLLWKQKQTLVEVIDRYEMLLYKRQVDDLNGLLNLVDYITDQWPVPLEYRQLAEVK